MRVSGVSPCIAVLVLVITGLMRAEAADVQEENDNPTIRNFSLPEYNEAMQLVSRIEGDTAKAVDDDSFDITNLRLEMYQNGKINARVTSPTCRFNKRKNQGWSKGAIRITLEDLVVTGEDYQFNGKKEQIHIQKNAKVVLRSANMKIWRNEDDNE